MSKAATIAVVLSLAALALAQEPRISAASAIAIDADTGKVLYERSADTIRYPASTTKILTTLLLLERTTPEEQIIAPIDCDTVGGSSMHLKPRERVPSRDMAYALMLRSANDGSYAVAKHLAGSVEGFSAMMNERARQMGCTNTNFNNPHGLNDDLHTTTARDLAIIAREAMKNPEFASISKTKRITIRRSVNREDIVMISKNHFLNTDSTYTGIKTGYTNPAGRCFVGSATKDGKTIITVVLKSEDWVADTDTLMKWVFNNYRTYQYIQPGQKIGELEIEAAREPIQPAIASEAVTLFARHDDIHQIEPALYIRDDIQLPVSKGDVIGHAEIAEADGTVHRVDLHAADEILAKPTITERVSSPSGVIILAALAGLTYIVRKRARRI